MHHVQDATMNCDLRNKALPRSDQQPRACSVWVFDFRTCQAQQDPALSEQQRDGRDSPLRVHKVPVRQQRALMLVRSAMGRVRFPLLHAMNGATSDVAGEHGGAIHAHIERLSPSTTVHSARGNV